MRFLRLLAALSCGITWGAYAQALPASVSQLASEDQERVAHAHGAVEALRDHMSKLEQEMDKARGSKDIVKLNYLSDKLKGLKGLLKVCIQAEANLQDALIRHDMSAASHEEEKLSIAGLKGDALYEQSQSAVGQSAVFSGDTQVELFVNERIAGSTVTSPVQMILTPPPASVIVTVRPPAASPFQ